jgi:threonine dehydratase
MSGTIPLKNDLLQARDRIRQHIHHTPLLTSKTINTLLEAEVFFKCENFQKAGAFKFRGATNAIRSLSTEDQKRGVATHSSGNHAQALALAAKQHHIPAYIVMPENAPNVKVNAVKGYGGIITFCKPTLQAREETLAQVIEKTNAKEIHPYNNLKIICGQSTAAQEVFEEVPEPDYFITPVGGGGLLSGTALACHYLSPDTKVLAAEPSGADDAYRSFNAGTLIPSTNPDTIADGLLTSLGSLTFPVIKNYVDNILLADEAFIIEAMLLIWERMKIVIEPSAALPLAVLLQQKSRGENFFKGKRIVLLLSGGNIDLNKLPWQ